ncbi:hypothetical protein AB432_018565 [Brevibacillus brevis]|uniref:HNH endonuclease n=1 Tax=Brevibacillus brevis TaxID=1393 RepID=A0A2Z4MKE0_BREBE|nr:hypothetical protein [Brevibacillus brevis]AWX56928.1 hypothetical protein AB432_018565 [Brevibacillus brevis]
MRRVPKPNFSTEEVLLKCISNYTDTDLVRRFKASKGNIADWSNILQKKIETNTVSTIVEDKCIPPKITKNEMVKLYTDKLAKQGQPGREIYNDIMDLPKHRLCPICGYRPVDSLDHYLPKEKFPALSISPINLIPACMGCNKLKSSSKPNSPEEEFIHPYFDNIEDEPWLYLKVVEELPLTVYFIAEPSQSSWDDLKKIRVIKHFSRFRLGQLYSSYASNELSGKIYSLKSSFEQGGAALVRDELLKQIESFKYAEVNSWQIALYTGLYESQWFCEEALKKPIDKILK